MIPILYENNEASFTSNGLGRLRDCITCTVTEERNGIYECDFEYPVTGQNFDKIQVGRIIAVEHDDSNDVQPFDIVSISKVIDGLITVHCVHISYRQSYLTVTGKNINSLAAAFTLFGNASPSNPFSYWTDKTSTGYLGCAIGVPMTVRSMLGGTEGSILDTYGGEYEWDKFNVRLYASRGQQRDFTIRYGVNMTEYEDETDMSGCYSSCIPYWTDGTVTVVGDKQTMGTTTPSGRDGCIPLDVSEKFENKPTKSQVNSMGLQVMSAQNPTLPAQNITVSFVRLQDSPEYVQFTNLLRCSLCDTIKVIFPDYNTSGMFKIVKTVWDVLAERYEEMELGQLSISLADALGISDALGSSNERNDFYKAGGTVTLAYNPAMTCTGYVSGSTKVVRATLITPKRLDNITTISVNELIGELRGIQGYVDNASANTDLKTGYTVTAAKLDSWTIQITISKSSVFSNVTNNTPVAVGFNRVVMELS